jgi:nitrate reductase gamma subunit
MGAISIFVANVLPYITIVVFVGGLIYRIRGWLNLQVPMPLSVTYPQSRGEQIKNIANEVLFFPALLKDDRNLWLGAWPFHAALAFIIIGHLRLFSEIPDKMLLAIGLSEAGIDTLSAVSGGIVGIVILAALIYLLVRRITQPTVRQMSNVADYFVLLLLIAIVTAGNYMRFAMEIDIVEYRTFIGSIFALSPIPPPDNPVFILHIFLVQMLLIMLPFSKIIHPIGIFFTQGIKHNLVKFKQTR